jgi:hypothetical protein
MILFASERSAGAGFIRDVEQAPRTRRTRDRKSRGFFMAITLSFVAVMIAKGVPKGKQKIPM